MTVKEYAKSLGVSVITVRRAIKSYNFSLPNPEIREKQGDYSGAEILPGFEEWAKINWPKWFDKKDKPKQSPKPLHPPKEDSVEDTHTKKPFAKTLMAILPYLPLPMFGLAASYGVYHFASLFMPPFFAVIVAGGFECTYIGIAALELREHELKRGQRVALQAVIVSMIYNFMSAGITIIGKDQPQEVIASLHWIAQVILFLLHGLPIAWLCYEVAKLILHKNQK